MANLLNESSDCLPEVIPKALDTRTAAGRKAYDDSVLGVLKGAAGWVSSAQIRARLGGTSAQVRGALSRLVDLGEVEKRGRARATLYRARAPRS